jgi:DNA-binding response OmpR family regulator
MAPSLKDALVMFVECDDDTVVTTRAVLEVNDVAVLCVSSRQGAGDILQHRPDLLIVDVGLSDDAYGLVRDVRAETPPETERLRAVALVENEADTRRALEAGFDEVVVKPVQPRALVTRMKELLARHSTR